MYVCMQVYMYVPIFLSLHLSLYICIYIYVTSLFMKRLTIGRETDTKEIHMQM